MRSIHRCGRSAGFTLIELLVAISIMALMAVMSWRGLDAMSRAQAQTNQRADEMLTLQVGLSQWKTDLDAMAQSPNYSSLDWDGRALRITRRSSALADGLVVVAWTRRNDSGGQWLRWQSPTLRTLGEWSESWRMAARWAQSPSANDSAREVLITPLDNWQIFYYRNDAWTNPLSSDVGNNTDSNASTTLAGQIPGFKPLVISRPSLPEGLRLELMLPERLALSGKLTLDWVRPTLGGDKS
jgi:general secretion pathway protein J